MEVLKFALMHPSVIVITLILLLVIYGLIYRLFDRLIDKRCEERMKSALEEQEKELQKKREQFDAYVAEENEKLNHRHRVVINSLKHGFTKAPQQAVEEFSEELSIRFLRSQISNFLPDIYPNKNPQHWPKEMRDRLLRSVRDGISIKKINFIEAEIIGSEGDVYTTTLETCSCKDHDKRLTKHPYLPKDPTPCKHMLYLYLHLGHASYTGADVRRYTKQYQEAIDAAAPKKRKP